MSKKKHQKRESKLSILGILTIISGVISILLMAGAFTGIPFLNTNVIHIGISAHFRDPQPFSCYLFDAFYFFFTWGAIYYTVRHVPDLLQAIVVLIIYMFPIAAHILINNYGPWYAENAVDAIVMYVIFAILMVPGAAISGVQDYMKKRRAS